MNHEPMPDVPVERSSVGAMGWMGNPYPDRFLETFKPYVYRGTGEDTLTPELNMPGPLAKPRKPKPRLAQNRRKPKPRRKHYHRHTWVYTPPPVYVEPEPEPEPLDEGEKFPAYVPALPTVLRPAPGWEPTSGAELEALLEEMS
jgi:hypothetical protein